MAADDYAVGQGQVTARSVLSRRAKSQANRAKLIVQSRLMMNPGVYQVVRG
jgi:hypothetical protein